MTTTTDDASPAQASALPVRQPGTHRTAPPGPASLARLIKDHGDTWTVEHTGATTAWVAVRRDGDDLRIVGAHDVGGLRYKIEQAEKEDAAGPDDQ